MGRKIVSGSLAKMGRVFFGDVEFCAEDWDITHSADEEEVTNTCGAGAEEFETTTARLEGSINYNWDASDNPWELPLPDLSAGREIATKLYINASPGGDPNPNGPFFDFTMKIISHQNTVPVKGKVTGVVTFKSTGTFILPIGQVASASSG